VLPSLSSRRIVDSSISRGKPRASRRHTELFGFGAVSRGGFSR
jgi:hypothetical protein